MTLLANLIAAEQAVKFANDQLQGRSSNRPEDLVHTMLQNLREQGYDRPSIQDQLASSVNVSSKTKTIWSERVTEINDKRESRSDKGLRLNAAAIAADNVGNCFEHCVLACHYLNRRGVASYMADTDANTNHVFVLIGLPGGLDGHTVNVTPNAFGPAAGAFTVVCDPWYHEWFGVQQDWGRKMRRIFAATTKYPPAPNPIPLKLTSGAHVT